ncbi:MAG: M56 family metallopeptidase [Oscillospiraceae bacterium]|jgi:beta-lactamase regulating signal transducer with metallopeptidase domain|nr:M56 family metallopeptidase [Oscillospiraceae bacterium]
MSAAFAAIFNMSVTASVIAAAVFLVRLPLRRRMPKLFSYALWLLVFIRLVLPVTIPSPFSLFNAVEAPPTPSRLVGENVSFGSAIGAAFNTIGDALDGGIGTVTVYLDPAPDTPAGYTPTTEAYHSEAWLLLLGHIWVWGVSALVLYVLVSYALVALKLRTAVLYRGYGENVYTSDGVQSPIVFGLFKPRIYLPSDIDAVCTEREIAHIVSHERVHIRRFDHVTKLLSMLVLAVHWFNPVIWAAFLLSNRDREIACDERVMQLAGGDIRAEYARSLVSIGTYKGNAFGALAFGESGIKTRVKSIVSFKKRALWLSVIAVVLLAVVGVVCLTGANSRGVPVGDYILSDAEYSPYITVLGDAELRLNNFDMARLLELYVIESTDETGADLRAALQSVLPYSAQKDKDGQTWLYAQVTPLSGLRIRYSKNQLELFGETYTLGGETPARLPLAAPRVALYNVEQTAPLNQVDGWYQLEPVTAITVAVPDGTNVLDIYCAEAGTEAEPILLCYTQGVLASSFTYAWSVSDYFPNGFLGHIWAVETDLDGTEFIGEPVNASYTPYDNTFADKNGLFYVTLPESWRGKFRVEETDTSVRFINLANENAGYGGVLCYIQILDVAEWNAMTEGDRTWAPYTELGSAGGKTFILRPATDIEFKWDDDALAAEYNEMADARIVEGGFRLLVSDAAQAPNYNLPNHIQRYYLSDVEFFPSETFAYYGYDELADNTHMYFAVDELLAALRDADYAELADRIASMKVPFGFYATIDGKNYISDDKFALSFPQEEDGGESAISVKIGWEYSSHTPVWFTVSTHILPGFVIDDTEPIDDGAT